MSNRKRSPLRYSPHTDRHGVKRARTRIPLGQGKYREISLGIWGSPESRDKFRAVCEEYERCCVAELLPRHGLTVADLCAAFVEDIQAQGRYRHQDGSPTRELDSWVYSLRPLLRLHADLLARDFGPRLLKALRAAMADGSWLTDDERTERQRQAREICWSRKTINQRVRRLVRVFGWGVSEQLLSAEVHQALLAVEPLPIGSQVAADPPERQPVPEQDVDDTIPCLPPVPRAMVLLQLVTGMRPGEVCAMRRADIDRRGRVIDGASVWIYRPGSHKTAHHGIGKAVPLGPAAQSILRPFLDAGGASPFVFPGAKGAAYVLTTYDHQIRAACRAAGVPCWSPNQLRKSRATELEELVDLDTARATLGHTTAGTTKRYYARADEAKAAKAARRLG